MHCKLLLSGDRADFTTLALDLDKKKLSILANYAAPYNASWIEPVSSQGSVDQLLGLSEGDDAGLLYSFEVDHAHKACKITSQQPTLGAPGHCESCPMLQCFFLETILMLTALGCSPYTAR